MVGRAALAVFGLDAVAVGLRPCVERNDVDGMAVFLNRGPAAAVAHQRVGLRAEKTGHVVDGHTGGDDLRIIVVMAAQIHVLVTVATGCLGPSVDKEAVFLVHVVGRVGLEDALGLAPHADVGILGLDPVNEAVVVVGLSVPHAVLDVPVEQAQVVLVLLGVGRDGQEECHCQ